MTAIMEPPPAEMEPAPVDEPSENKPPGTDRLARLSPAAESQLVGEVRNLFLRAKDRRRPMVDRWNRCYRVLRTRNQWSDARPAHMPRPDVPEIWPVVDTIVSWVTDQEPTFAVTPAVSPMHPLYPAMSQLSEDLRVVVRSSWQVDKTSAEIEKVVWDGLTYGIGWLKTTWNPKAYQGHGNAVMYRVDPYSLYPDPDAADMDTANYLIEARTVSMQELERRYPGAEARIREAGLTEDVDKQPNTVDRSRSGSSHPPMANPGAISPATSPRYGLPGQSGRASVVDDPGVTLFEAWLRTPTTTEDGRTFDTWRCVVVAGNRVLMDETADNLWEHGQHPYERYVPIETGEFYGTSMVEQLAPMQESINKILAAMEHNIWLTGNPVWMEDARAGISRTKITNQPGQRIQKNQGDAGWVEPPTMATSEAQELVKFYIEQMERISGMSAVVRGATPSGRNAQGVIDSVQEAAFVRIRKALRNLSMTIGGGGEKMASLIVEFYDTPRIVSLLGSSGESAVRELRTNHFYVPGPDGMAPMRFQLLIDAGESASQSRGQRISEADALFALGVIDEEAVLQVHDFPNWQQVVQRVRELKAQSGELGQPPTQRAAARH